MESAGQADGVMVLPVQKELTGQGAELPPLQTKPGGHALHLWLAVIPRFSTYMPSAHTHPEMDAVPTGEDELAGHEPHWALET